MSSAAFNRISRLTGPGVSAVAVLRIQGQAVVPFLADHFSKPAVPRRCVHGTFRDARGEFDDGLVVLFGDPPVADLNLHGSFRAVERLLEAARAYGFEPAITEADWIELADGETLLDREINHALSAVRTEAGLRLLTAQREAWGQLSEMAAREPSKVDLDDTRSDLTLTRMLVPARVAIVGAANAGKSTLANKLFDQRRSLVADLPGTTRDWVSGEAEINGMPIVLLDTPGTRAAPGDIEARAIQAALEATKEADVLIELVDVSADPPDLPVAWRSDSSRLLVASKCDLPARWDPVARSALPVSAHSGQGLNELKEKLLRSIGASDPRRIRPLAWTERQRLILTKAVDDPAAIAAITSSSEPRRDR